MKKKISFCILFLNFAVFSANAYGKYGGITNRYYYGEGVAGSKYCGTTKNLTIEEVHNDRWMSVKNDKMLSDPQLISGKLSKRQSRLLWYALEQYDYELGEIYSVNFREIDAPSKCFALSVKIEADGSCTWKGFTYYE